MGWGMRGLGVRHTEDMGRGRRLGVRSEDQGRHEVGQTRGRRGEGAHTATALRSLPRGQDDMLPLLGAEGAPG